MDKANKVGRWTVYLVALLMGTIFALPAQAYITVNLDSLSGAYIEHDGSGWGTDPFDAGDAVVNSLLQVIWSEDAFMGRPLPGGGIESDYDPGTDDTVDTDIVLYSGLTDSIGQVKEEESNAGIDLDNTTGRTDADFYNGYVYLRVFNTANPQANDWYVSGSRQGVGILQGDLVENPTFASDYAQLDMTLSPDAVQDPNYTDFDHVPMNMTVVPEPGTFALFGVGLVTLVARRRRRG